AVERRRGRGRRLLARRGPAGSAAGGPDGGVPRPMLPLEVFGSRQFSAVNAVTFLVYGGMGVLFFLLVLQLQVVGGFSPVAAGAALLPVTVLMLLLSARAGAVAQKIGPRWPMTAGLLVAAAGMLLVGRIGAGASYPREVLPAVTLFGLGLSAVVAPLTATVLATARSRHAGVASGVNNAVARAAGLLAVAAIPPLTGLTGGALRDPDAFAAGFGVSMTVCAGLLVAGAALTLLTISDGALHVAEGMHCEPEARSHCSVGAPQLQPEPETVPDRDGDAAAGKDAAGPG
ncbi:MFS transporter, partial [Actinomadura sp. CNU-125]|uniref:MFS transporter n=1 Tax=Actinomadura sp. CNU-125 TaxID=1904961 RepID=UPI0011780083